MPESIISQFRREYNSPIETDRQVNNINARDAINSLTRWEGMNVYVISEGITYSLVGGLDNTNWVAVAGIGEAPIDGASYVRRDGGWELMPANSGVWGSITGTLSDQTDLQSELNGKLSISGGTMTGSIDAGKQNIGNIAKLQIAAGGPGGLAWEARSQTTGNDLVFLSENSAGSGIFTPVKYKLNDSGIPTDNTDVVTKGYADSNYKSLASGSFTTADSKTVTVTNGIITSIV